MLHLLSPVVISLFLCTSLGPEEPQDAARLTHYARSIPADLFGMHIINGNYPTVSFGVLRTTGVGWPQIETSSGVFDWRRLDAQVAVALAHNLKVYYTTGNVPVWAAADPASCKAGKCSSGVASLADWDGFIGALVSRYKGRIEVYELWNEPDQDFTGTMAEFVELARHYHDLVRSLDKDALLASPGVVNVNWLGKFWGAGGLTDVDAVAFHGYSTPPVPERLQSAKVAPLRVIAARYGLSSLPVWDSESSWGEPANLADPAAQVGYIARSYLLHWAYGVSRFYWYSWDDNGSAPGLPGWGSLADWSTNRPLPAAIAYSIVRDWMVGATMNAPCAADSDSTWTCGLIRGTRYRAMAVWNAAGTRQYVPPTIYTQFRDLAGNVKHVAGPVTIGSQPILLETRPEAPR